MFISYIEKKANAQKQRRRLTYDSTEISFKARIPREFCFMKSFELPKKLFKIQPKSKNLILFSLKNNNI